MAITTTSVEIYRGDTWPRSWRITNNGNPVDFTGASARLQVRATKEVNDNTVIINAEIGSGLEFGGDGVINLFVQTENVPAGKYYFDIEVKFSNGLIKTYEQGTLILKQDITRD